MDRQELESAIELARAEGVHDAVPASLAESLEINKKLRDQLSQLADAFSDSRSSKTIYKERAVGFLFGIGASLAAAFLWWLLIKYVPQLGIN
ncbi:hypothetical protein ACOPJQ_05080 [Luteimonas dalianensis]|uniref:hypothetical protein n=1 Tax=Luteimonas dalianensis TaxID=1148196 RepID=UPI003BF026C5